MLGSCEKQGKSRYFARVLGKAQVSRHLESQIENCRAPEVGSDLEASVCASSGLRFPQSSGSGANQTCHFPNTIAPLEESARNPTTHFQCFCTRSGKAAARLARELSRSCVFFVPAPLPNRIARSDLATTYGREFKPHAMRYMLLASATGPNRTVPLCPVRPAPAAPCRRTPPDLLVQAASVRPSVLGPNSPFALGAHPGSAGRAEPFPSYVGNGSSYSDDSASSTNASPHCNAEMVASRLASRPYLNAPIVVSSASWSGLASMPRPFQRIRSPRLSTSTHVHLRPCVILYSKIPANSGN